MTPDWKEMVEKENARVHVLPTGWDSADDVGKALGCNREKVREHLASLIQNRVVETKIFIVWDPVAKMKIKQTAYRRIPKAS